MFARKHSCRQTSCLGRFGGLHLLAAAAWRRPVCTGPWVEVDTPLRPTGVKSRVPCTAGAITGNLARDLAPTRLLSSHWTDTSGGHLLAWHWGHPRWLTLRAKSKTQSVLTCDFSACRGSVPSHMTGVELNPTKARAGPGLGLCAGSFPTSGPCLSQVQVPAWKRQRSERWAQTQNDELPPSAASSPRSLGGSAESSGMSLSLSLNLQEESLVGKFYLDLCCVHIMRCGRQRWKDCCGYDFILLKVGFQTADIWFLWGLKILRTDNITMIIIFKL